MQLSNLCTAPQNRHLLELFLPVCYDLLELLGSGSGLSPSLADVDRELASSGFFVGVLLTLGLVKVGMPYSSGMLAFSAASLMNSVNLRKVGYLPSPWVYLHCLIASLHLISRW